MSILELFELIDNNKSDIFNGFIMTSIVLFFVFCAVASVNASKAEEKADNEKREIKKEKAKKYYGDLSNGAIYLGQVANKPHEYLLDRFSINGEEFIEYIDFDRFDKRPKINEHWKVELDGTKLKFIEKIGLKVDIKSLNEEYEVKTTNNIKFHGISELGIPKDKFNSNNITIDTGKVETLDTIKTTCGIEDFRNKSAYLINKMKESEFKESEIPIKKMEELEQHSRYFVKIKGREEWEVAQKSFMNGFHIVNKIGLFRPNNFSNIIGPITPEDLIDVAGKTFKLEGMV